ncbi:MAG: TRAP transporter small permease [Deltaproteobacteria bacterium]|nr:TRAP transporter small permease [Deltaproteobacteria bacterium]
MSKGLQTISGIILLCVIVLTIGDIVGRSFGTPIVGTFELVSAAGGLVIAFALPMSSKEKKHVIIDLLLERVSHSCKTVLHAVSRVIAIALLLALSWAFVQMGKDIRVSGEVSSILQFPLHPLVWAMGGAFLGECLVVLDELLSLVRSRETRHG